MDSLLFVTLSISIAIGALVWYVGLGVVRSQQNTSGSRLASLNTRQDHLQKDFSQRAIAPMVRGMGRFALRFTPAGWVARAQKKIIWAGWAERMDGNTWAAIRLITAVVGVVAAFFVVPLVSGTLLRIAVGALILFLGLFGPEASLNRAIDDRRKQMEKQLPDIIDLLVISVEAGLGFEAAMGRVVQTVPGELSTEFQRTLAETRVGISRHTALRNMSERTDVDDLNSFILALIQADQFGVSIARMLRVQAEEMRVRRRQRIQERAFAAPVKMIFPMMFCIFPSIFIIILGPAAISISDNLL
ncbi:MAG: type II secretion system F family protein [Armatimonadetes bacterium]|nr:MAG: type II secretion system F family protein [Armatimonadota bacterium]